MLTTGFYFVVKIKADLGWSQIIFEVRSGKIHLQLYFFIRDDILYYYIQTY